MKIAILGNGKMGKRISKLATLKGYDIVCISDSNSPAKSLDLSIADVAIDFSTPQTAFENISHAINSDIPVVSGTTGWLNKLQKINDLCIAKGGAFIYASNFSLGVNIFFELNRKLAELMKDRNYVNSINEIHHTHKLDSPSGTAISLAEQINKKLDIQTKITSERINNTNGIHQITYSSKADKIEIKHTANNRDGFAIGAIIAANWIIGKKGIYSMKDILNL
jgi:4-hydroxy-tetrahydrodipicolinate reductase